MKTRKVEWSKLDNASKIFPATYHQKDTKVFRISCELTELVDPAILQQALDLTMESFPLYKSILRRGVFWHYFEFSDIAPLVEPESKPVCARIYIKGKKNLLFRVFYRYNRINLEIFHALSDGTGALRFTQTMVHRYLTMKYKEAFEDHKPKLHYSSASLSETMSDSFKRHFTGDRAFTSPPKRKKAKAYRVRGTRLEENRTLLIEGSMSADAALDEAHKYGTTLTVFIASVFIYALYKNMTAREKQNPVVLSVPINLRQFYESETAGNFFTTMNVGCRFTKSNVGIEEIIATVKDIFKEGVSEEKMSAQLNRLVAFEKNPLIKIIPLPLKNFILRLVHRIKDREISATISGIGRIEMPAEFAPYIRQFSFCTSARRPQIIMCSYGDRLVISFTSPFRDTEIQTSFFQFLAKKGIEIEISSNS